MADEVALSFGAARQPRPDALMLPHRRSTARLCGFRDVGWFHKQLIGSTTETPPLEDRPAEASSPFILFVTFTIDSTRGVPSAAPALLTCASIFFGCMTCSSTSVGVIYCELSADSERHRVLDGNHSPTVDMDIFRRCAWLQRISRMLW